MVYTGIMYSNCYRQYNVLSSDLTVSPQIIPLRIKEVNQGAIIHVLTLFSATYHVVTRNFCYMTFPNPSQGIQNCNFICWYIMCLRCLGMEHDWTLPRSLYILFRNLYFMND